MKPTLLAASLLLLVTGCITPAGDTPQERIDSAMRMHDETLATFAEREPEAHAALADAPAYLVVTGFHLHPGLITFGNGYYVMKNNATGEVFHGSMKRVALGPGLAAKSFRIVIPLDHADDFDSLKAASGFWGWLAEASFQAGDFGGSAAALGAVADQTYVWNEAGFALEVAFGHAWVGEDEDLQLDADG